MLVDFYRSKYMFKQFKNFPTQRGMALTPQNNGARLRAGGMDADGGEAKGAERRTPQ